jgi:hypothetical protein
MYQTINFHDWDINAHEVLQDLDVDRGSSCVEGLATAWKTRGGTKAKTSEGRSFAPPTAELKRGNPMAEIRGESKNI